MPDIYQLKEERSIEIVKIFLLKLNVGLLIETPPTEFFDFIVSLENDPKVRFAIEVKSKLRFKSRVNKQITYLKRFRDQRLITIPVIIVKVDDIKETGEFDFLIFPSFIKKQLLVRYTFKFSELNEKNFKQKLKSIIKWYDKLPEFSNYIEQERTITEDELDQKARTQIKKAYYGKAITAYIEIVGLHDQIIIDWNKKYNKSLITLHKIKNYLDFAISTTQTVLMFDYDSITLLEEIEFPHVISSFESFVFVLPLDEQSNQRTLASIFSVIATCLEIWQISINNGFTIRGAIEFEDVFYSKSDPTIVGKAINSLKELMKLSENEYRVIISENIKLIIRESLNQVNPAIIDYFRRFIFIDDDGVLAINPALILANTPEKSSHFQKQIEKMINKTYKSKTRLRGLIDKVYNQDIRLNDVTMFE